MVKNVSFVLLLVFLFSGVLVPTVASAAPLLSEGFETTTFSNLPVNWKATILSGAKNWYTTTSSSAHAGTRTVYLPWLYVGDSAVLVSPSFSLTSAFGTNVKFWMYRQANTSNYLERMEIYVNTASNLTGATLLGTIYRAAGLSPVVAATGWYEYTYEIPGAYNGSTNYILFKGIGDDGYGMSLDDISIVPSVVPDAPTNPSAILTGLGKAAVSFTPPASNGGSAITKYTATSIPGGFIGSGSSSPVTVSGLAIGTAYTFTVTATNPVGDSPASTESNSVTPGPVPGAPTIGTATPGPNVGIVSFTSPTSDGGNPITGYMAISNPGGFIGTGTTSPVFVGGLTGGTSYTFTVAAASVNGYGPVSAPSNSVTPTEMEPKIATGAYHTLALKRDGTIWAWGYSTSYSNDYGQLGDGTTKARITAAQVSGLTGVAAIAAGEYHSLAVKSDGTVWAWGYNVSGQLGDGTNTQRTSPVQVSGLTGIIAVAAGKGHSLALKSDGTVWAWGSNSNGQLGDGTFTQRTAPVQVTGITNAVAINAYFKGYASAAVLADGKVWEWGYLYTALYYGNSNTAPIVVPDLSDVTKIAIGYNHNLALKSDGTVWAWGSNSGGQLGDGTTTGNYGAPGQVPGLSDIISVAAIEEFSAAVKSDGTLWTWGFNYHDQLGYDVGASSYSATPGQVVGATQVVSAVFSYYDAFALSADGQIHKWGDYAYLDRTVTDASSTPFSLKGVINAGADLQVTISGNTGDVRSSCGSKTPADLVYTISVTNNGSVDANWVTLTNGYGYSAAFTSVDAPVFCFWSGKSCSLGTIAPLQTVTVILRLSDSYAGSVTLNSSVQSASDPLLTNNAAANTLVVKETSSACPPSPFSGAFNMPEDSGIAVGNLQAKVGDTGATITSFEIVTPPQHGTVTLSGDIVKDSTAVDVFNKEFNYQPALHYSGDDSFTFKVTDSNGTTSVGVGTISVKILHVNHAPTSTSGIFTTIKDTSFNGSLNAADIDVGDTLTFSISAQSAHGTVQLTNAATGAFTYAPNAAYHGTDSFTFQAKDNSTIVATELSNVATVTITVLENKAYTILSLDSSAATILQNGTISATGKLTRLPDAGDDMTGNIVTLTITAPDTTTQTLSTTTYDIYGHYIFNNVSVFTQKGTYGVKTSFTGSALLAASTSETKSVLVGASAGYAIIVEGKIANEEGLGSHNKTANRIYQKLKDRGFIDDNIQYFNYNTTQAGVDSVPSRGAIQFAIETWAKNKMNGSPAPLFLIMVDHGNPNTFYLGSETIAPADIAAWLSTLETGLTGPAVAEKRVVIIGSCYSGSFISALAHENRIIISSAAPDEESYKGPNEPDNVRSGEYFLEEFFKELGHGQSLSKAFVAATDKTEVYTRKGGSSTNSGNPSKYLDNAMQHPLLDDNSDGKGSNILSEDDGDGAAAAGMYLGIGVNYDTNSANNPADITSMTETLHLSSSITTTLLWAKANDDSQVSSAWYEVRSPSMTLSASGGSNQLEVSLLKVLMTRNNATGRWEAPFTQFIESGMYEVFYFVRDVDTNDISQLKRSVVYKNKAGNNAPTAFNPLSPVDASEQKTVLLFNWETSTDPDTNPITYSLLLSRDATFGTVDYRIEEIQGASAAVGLDAKLLDLTTYYWKIKAIDSYGAFIESSIRSFSTNNTNGLPGILSGYVIDAGTQAPVASATISITGAGSTTSALNGAYLMTLPTGNATITASATGYQSAPGISVTIAPGDTIRKNISLASTVAEYTITSQVTGTGGSISPSGPQTVISGSTTTFTVTPNSGYAAQMSGTCIGTLIGTTYTTNPITANCTVTASFTANPVNGACGSSNGQTLNSAPTTNFCSSGNASLVSGSGPWTWSCGGLNSGTTATCSASIQTYTVTPSAGTGGSLSPSTAQTVNSNSTTSFTVTPTAGYSINSVSGCNGTLVNATYTTGSITASCTVSATFTKNQQISQSGDLDGNGTVEAADALRALRIVAGLQTSTSSDLSSGDVAPLVNGVPQPDGKIDLGDVVVILRRAVGLVSW